MPRKLKILHLEDMPTDAELVGRELQRSALLFEKLLVDNKADYTRALKEYQPDIILSDHSLPSFNSIEALNILRESGLKIPFILVTATVSEEFAVSIMKEGATDYILKDRMPRLPNAIANAIEKYQLDAEQQRANQELQFLFNTIDEVFFSVDAVNSKLIKISPACEKVYGYTPAAFLENPDLWNKMVHPEDRHIQQANYQQLSLDDSVVSQYRIIHKNQNIRWLENKIIPSLSETGSLLRLYGVSRDITERKEAELNLEQSERRFRELLENSSDMLTITNLSGVITYISANVKKILGYDVNEFETQRKGVDFFHPDGKQNYQNIFDKLRQTPGKIYPFISQVKHANGDWRWIEGTVTNLLHIPAVNGIITNFRDITERKRSEDLIERNHIELQQASKTQADILNALPPNIVLLNEKCKIIAVNESWKKFTIRNNLGMPGYGVKYSYLAIAEKATGADHLDTAKMEKGIKEVIAGTKMQFTMEYASYTAHEEKWFQLVVAPLANNTTDKGAVVLHIDITDRKLAEKSRIQSEANLRSVFENTDLSITLFDSSLKIISFNHNAKIMALENYHKKLKIGSSAFKYFPKERKSAITRIMDQVANRETVCYETSFEHKDGTREWYDVKWMGVLNHNMENAGTILTIKNITEKKNAEIERNKMTSDLIQRNKDLEQFTYIVSHNLRAPVANILGLSNLLLDFEPEGGENEEALKALSITVNNLDGVILDLNNILQVNSLVNSKIEKVSLSALVEEIRSGISHMITKNNATLTCDFSDVDELLILKSYLYSIFQNLVVNSIKYHRTGVDPTIHISSKRNGNKVIIIIEDNGKGMDLSKYGDQLFGLYKRFDYSVEGKGMGLFMVKMQVESLDGTILVNSELNAGTEFKLEFPIQ